MCIKYIASVMRKANKWSNVVSHSTAHRAPINTYIEASSFRSMERSTGRGSIVGHKWQTAFRSNHLR